MKNPLLQPNFIIASIFLLATLSLFTIIILNRLGGDNALFAILGHTAAWIELIAIFYFRKKPPT